MNKFHAQAVFDGTCYLAMYRLGHQARHRPVTDERRQAIRYPTPEQARIAAHEALLAELNGNECFWRGPSHDDARVAAERKWGQVWHGQGRTQAEDRAAATERAAISSTG